MNLFYFIPYKSCQTYRIYRAERNLLLKMNPIAQAISIEKIIVIAPLGIGNTILLIPTLKACKELLPHCSITVAVFTRQGEEILEHCPYVDNVVSFFSILPKNAVLILKQLRLLYNLRKKRFDIILTAFPTNHALYNLLAWAIHAKTRIAHQYLVKRVKSLSFLQTIKVAIEPCHDVEQNLNLLLPLGISFKKKDLSLELWIPEEVRIRAKQFITPYTIQGEEFLIGIHAGSSQKRKMSYKRWPAEKFAILAKKLRKHYPMIRIFLFGGKEEEQLNQEIAQTIGQHATIVQRSSILETAALIEKMSLFISNDSGLMHIAVSVGVPTVAIFGPTDATRTAPYGSQHRVLRKDLKCSPCWPLEKVGQRDECPYDKPVCLTELSVSTLFQAVCEMINSKIS